jgi:hypothetical protein
MRPHPARRCACHEEPMDWRPGRQRWECAVRRRARQLARYHGDPMRANYARYRRRARARTAFMRVRIAMLEAELMSLGGDHWKSWVRKALA